MKGTKFRSETTVGGMKMVSIIDGTAMTAYQIVVDQNIAMKVDLSQVKQAAGVTSDQDPLTDSKLIGLDTIDGKPAIGFEGKTAAGPMKVWYWIEKGVPLKSEITGSEGVTVVEYSNYVFAPQPDSLFQLPAGIQVMDLPIPLPGKPTVKP